MWRRRRSFEAGERFDFGNDRLDMIGDHTEGRNFGIDFRRDSSLAGTLNLV
jgi:hypothetical protein